VIVRFALSITAPGVYVPAASWIESPATAWLTAYWTVEQGADGWVQAPLAAEPPASTYRVAADAADGEASASTAPTLARIAATRSVVGQGTGFFIHS
jgi:hypothetical protein